MMASPEAASATLLAVQGSLIWSHLSSLDRRVAAMLKGNPGKGGPN
jgi:hypothetical protein